MGGTASFPFSSIALHSNKEEKARTLPSDADNHESSRGTLMLQDEPVQEERGLNTVLSNSWLN